MGPMSKFSVDEIQSSITTTYIYLCFLCPIRFDLSSHRSTKRQKNHSRLSVSIKTCTSITEQTGLQTAIFISEMRDNIKQYRKTQRRIKLQCFRAVSYFSDSRGEQTVYYLRLEC